MSVGPVVAILVTASFLLDRLPDLFKRLDIESFPDDSDLLRFDIADDVNEHGFTVAFDDGDDHALHGFLAAGLEVNAYVFVLFLRRHNAFPTLSVQVAADLLHARFHLGAIAVVQPDDVDPNAVETTEEFRNLRLALLREAGDHGDQVAGDVDFDEFPARGRRRELAEVNKAGRSVFGVDTEANEGGERQSGTDRVFHNDYGR